MHKRKAAANLQCKKDIVSEAKSDDSILVIEFDYGQNLPLPKLNVTSQFYKRLMWLYLFNVHVHNDDTSHFYCFLKSDSKKGPDSVASFVYKE